MSGQSVGAVNPVVDNYHILDLTMLIVDVRRLQRSARTNYHWQMSRRRLARSGSPRPLQPHQDSEPRFPTPKPLPIIVLAATAKLLGKFF
jgi:hypothetical protein